MKGYYIQFQIYAENEQEVADARKAVIGFIGELASMGVAVSAKKITDGLSHWKDNVFVKNKIINFFKNK